MLDNDHTLHFPFTNISSIPPEDFTRVKRKSTCKEEGNHDRERKLPLLPPHREGESQKKEKCLCVIYFSTPQARLMIPLPLHSIIACRKSSFELKIQDQTPL